MAFSDPSAKRVAAKLSSAPTRNSLNIAGGGSKAAAVPLRKRIVDSLMGSANSGKMPNGQKAPGVTPPRRKKGSFGDSSMILQSETKKTTTPMDKLPASRGGANMKGVD